jgi:hypothetical protein
VEGDRRQTARGGDVDPGPADLMTARGMPQPTAGHMCARPSDQAGDEVSLASDGASTHVTHRLSYSIGTPWPEEGHNDFMPQTSLTLPTSQGCWPAVVAAVAARPGESAT